MDSYSCFMLLCSQIKTNPKQKKNFYFEDFYFRVQLKNLTLMPKKERYSEKSTLWIEMTDISDS